MGMGTRSDAKADGAAEPGLDAEDDDGMPDWDDDDLIAMQAEPMVLQTICSSPVLHHKKCHYCLRAAWH